MTDLTKEELNTIIDAFNHICDAPEWRNTSGWDDELQTKIQSMIDNFPKCDHRSGLCNYNENGEVTSVPTDIYRCRHCDILFRFIYDNGICIGHEDLE